MIIKKLTPNLTTLNNTFDLFPLPLSDIIKKKSDIRHWFKPNVWRRRKLFERWSNTTLLFDFWSWKGKESIATSLWRCLGMGLFSLLLPMTSELFLPWQWAAICGCHSAEDVGQNSPFNQEPSHQPTFFLTQPSVLCQSFAVFTLCTHGDYPFPCLSKLLLIKIQILDSDFWPWFGFVGWKKKSSAVSTLIKNILWKM